MAGASGRRHSKRNPSDYPRVPPSAEREAIRALVDEGIAQIREVDRILALLHGTPDLGNKADPVDELVYIMLSRKTREDAYQDSLRQAEGTASLRWEKLLASPRAAVERIVSPGGLGEKKTASLFAALETLGERFGSCTLEPALAVAGRRARSLPLLPAGGQPEERLLRDDVLDGAAGLPGRHSRRSGPAATRPVRGAWTRLSWPRSQAAPGRLADLVPPNLRHSLHVNLVVHGREVCKAIGPDCGECELRRSARTSQVRGGGRGSRHPSARPCIDLFSGAGGLSEGFRRAGFRLVSALDTDSVALKTLWLNHPSCGARTPSRATFARFAPKDFRKMLGRRRLDVLIGAPPCQGFSRAGFRSKAASTGYRLEKDDRNYLFEYLVDLAVALRPRLFLMENVPGWERPRRRTSPSWSRQPGCSNDRRGSGPPSGS